MVYKLLRTDVANDQFRDVVFYIAQESGDVDVALNYLNKIEKAIKQLEEFPYLGVEPKYSILRKQGYRVLIVERHLVFYKVDEQNHIVMIHAIVDSRTEYKNLL